MRVIFVLFFLIALAICKEEEKASQRTEDVLSKNFNPGIAPSRQTGYGLVKFEGQDESSTQTKFGLISFDGQTSHSDQPLKFKDQFGLAYTNDQNKHNTGKRGEGSQIVFQGEKETPNSQSYSNSVQNPGQKKKKRRRRRRRRKLRPTLGARPQTAYNPGVYRLETGYKPPEHTGPLSVLGEMLASLARNDDAGCVTRMLCEQAAGGALSNSSILTTIAWIITSLPKLQETIATASGSFERFAMAVYYGSASKNQSICKEKYPRCPTDPEDLANYLNSHNFSQYNPNALQNGLVNNYGFQTEEATDVHQYGYLQSGIPQLSYPPGPSSYGFYQKGPHKLRSDSVHEESYSHYDPTSNKIINYKKDYFKTNFKDNDNSIDQIENRIQNHPGNFDVNNLIKANDVNLKWSFPKDYSSNQHQEFNIHRGGRLLKFPDNTKQTLNNHLDNRKTKEATGFSFPGAQSNRQYFDDQILVNGDFGIDNMDFEKVKDVKALQNLNDERAEFVYVVRGNGDPNHPEIIKLRPREKLF